MRRRREATCEGRGAVRAGTHSDPRGYYEPRSQALVAPISILESMQADEELRSKLVPYYNTTFS